MDTLGLGSLAAVNLLLVLSMQGYVLAVLGAGRASDAVFASLAFAQFILNILNAVLVSVLLPLLAVQPTPERQRAGWDLTYATAVTSGSLAVLVGLSAPIWVPVLLPGFSSDDASLAVSLTRIQAISILAGALSAAAWSACRAFKRYYWGEAAALVGNLAGLSFVLWLLPRIGPHAAAWGVVLRTAIPFAVMLPVLGRVRSPRWRSALLDEAWSRARPLLAGASLYKLTLLADRFLASLAPAGGLSILVLMQQVYSAWEQIVARSVTLPFVPALTRAAAHGRGAFDALHRRLFIRVGFLCAASFGVFVLLGPAVLRTASERISVPPGLPGLVLPLGLALSGQWIVGPLLLVLSSGYHARGETRVPAIVGGGGVLVGIGLRFLGFKMLGLVGIALGISAYCVVLLVIYLVYGQTRRMNEAGVHRTAHSDA